jgi:hypothetical protein
MAKLVLEFEAAEVEPVVGIESDIENEWVRRN